MVSTNKNYKCVIFIIDNVNQNIRLPKLVFYSHYNHNYYNKFYSCYNNYYYNNKYFTHNTKQMYEIKNLIIIFISYI